MKIYRPSKILLLSVVTALFAIVAGADNINAASRQPTYTIRDMMERRGRPPKSVARSTKPSRTVATTSAQSRTSNVSYKEASINRDGSLFPGGSCESCFASDPADKDGSLFPGGSCESCLTSDPADKDGSLFPGGPCVRCYNSGPLIDTGPCETCKRPQPRIANYLIAYTPYIYQAVARDCCAMAPLYLDHVDFKLNDSFTSTPYGEKLGNYRFRIFGCRRYDKEAILNQGRIMQKDMNFNKVFEEVTGDCYNLVKIPEDLCLQTTPSPLPEYLLSAEITDFFMNVCDGYNWDEARAQDKRSGSAEMTVTWRLTNLTKTAVLWEGTTTGYSDLYDGSDNGEIKLVEAAFADAVSNLRNMPGFEDQLMVRLTPEELTAQRNALIDEEIALNPAKCQFQNELQCYQQCQMICPFSEAPQCPAVTQQCNCQPVSVTPIIEDAGIIAGYEVFDNLVKETSGVVSGGEVAVVDDTWVDIQKDTKSFDSLCIVDRPPYDVLSPENLYKVRASVVEIDNNAGKKGAGLIISESFVLTSANLIDKANNSYVLKTINGKTLSGHAVRINPSKNIALIMLDEPTAYTPLSLNLDLPKVNDEGFMVLGILDVDNFADGENYIDNSGKVTGYRYSEDRGSEIMMDTFVQHVTIGGVLIDPFGTINGVAHTGQKTENGQDLFLPTETALRSVGLSICEKLYDRPSPWQKTVYKPVTEKILSSTPKAPEVLAPQERK